MWSAMQEGGSTWKEEVVKSEIEDGGEGLAERDEGGADTDDGASEDIIPVVDCRVVLVN